MCLKATKCALMVVNGSQTRLRDANITINGATVPIATTYKYLGFPFNSDLSMHQAAHARNEKLKVTTAQVRAFIHNAKAPLIAKLDILRTIVAPSATFGGEILGMNKQVSAPLESTLAKTIVPITRQWGRPAIAPLRRDLNIPSVFAKMSAMRARAILKYPSLQSTVRYITNPLHRLTTRHIYWSKQSRRWLDTNLTINTPATNPKQTARLIRKLWDGSSLATGTTTGARYYYVSKFFLTRRFLAKYSNLHRSNLDTGITGLLTARAGGIDTANRLAAAGKIDEYWRNACPCCEGTVKESVHHILVSCPAWNTERQDSKLQPLIDLLRAEHATLSDKNIATLLLGGTVSNNISLGQYFYKRPLFINSVRTTPGYLITATFLNSIHKRRQVLLWNSVDRIPAPSGDGSVSGSIG